MDTLGNELYNRQSTLSLNIPKSVGIVGIGGIGSWVAILSAMSGVPEIHLFDSDTLELSNLNRVPLTENDIGQSKTEAISSIVTSLRPSTMVISHGELDNEMQLAGIDVVIDCTDVLKTQRWLCSACKELEKRYIRAGYDGTHITVCSQVPNWSDDNRTGYEKDPSWVVPAVVVAGMAVAKMEKYSELDLSIDIGEIE